MYSAAGWRLFVLGRDKTPLPNCAACHAAGPGHDREACPCLTCHGFYAATADPARLTEMRARHPRGHLALRTGATSGVLVLDAEGTGDPSGVEVLDSWEAWSGGWPLPDTDLAAATPSGGVHLYFSHVPGVRSRNRVLPGLDVKADGGYVVIPDGTDPRRVWSRAGEPGEPTGVFREWLLTARGRGGYRLGLGGGSGVRGEGYDYAAFLRDGCPGGVRDEFFNELAFRLRKAGLDRARATQEARRHWQRCAQPDRPVGGTPAVWYMPWHDVEYKLERVWATVEVDDLGAAARDWAQAQAAGRDGRVGRVTLVGRS